MSYLGPLWAVRAEGADGAVQLGVLRLVSLTGLSADTRVQLLEAAWQAMEVRGDAVLPVTDVVASDGELGVVSDFVEGVTLRSLVSLGSVRKKPMPSGVALRIVLDLLDAIATLHRASAELGGEALPLYGGLSTDSVLVGTSGRTFVTDVAVSCAASTVESFGGSPDRVAYVAPEQLAASPDDREDARTDVFGVGVLAWELLTGRRLFVGSDKSLAQKVLTAKIPKLTEARRKGDPEVPAALANAVMKALEREPSKRFQSAEEFMQALAPVSLAGAATADVAEYVATVGEGALARAREALQNAESGTHQAVPPRTDVATAVAAPEKTRPSNQAPAPDVPVSPVIPPTTKLPAVNRASPFGASRAATAKGVAPAANPPPAVKASPLASKTTGVVKAPAATPAAVARTPAATKGSWAALNAAPATPVVPPAAEPATPLADFVTEVVASPGVPTPPAPAAAAVSAVSAKAPANGPTPSIPSPKRTSPAMPKIGLPRVNTNARAGAGKKPVAANRPTLQGGWALTQEITEALTAQRAAADAAKEAPAATPAPSPKPAATPAPKPMVKVGSSKARASGAMQPTKGPFPSVPPGIGGIRARQATMIGIPLPASPSSPDIDPGDDEATRDFNVVPPPPSKRSPGIQGTQDLAGEDAEVNAAVDSLGGLERLRDEDDDGAPTQVDPRSPVPAANDDSVAALLDALEPAPVPAPAQASRFEARLARPVPAPDKKGPLAALVPRQSLEPVTDLSAGFEGYLDEPDTEVGPIPPPAEFDVPPARKKTPIDVDDEEPTHQYNAKDLLKQVEAMSRGTEAEPHPGSADPTTVGSFDDPTTVGRFAEPPTAPGDPPLDGGWLDEPDTNLAIESALRRQMAVANPGDPAARVVRDWPPPPPAPPAGAAPLARRDDRTTSSRTTAKVTFPTPSSSPAGPSMIPSHVPPPLIHDPRANRGSTGKIAAVPARSPATSKPGAPPKKTSRWAVVPLSAFVVIATAAAAVYVLRARGEGVSAAATQVAAPPAALPAPPAVPATRVDSVPQAAPPPSAEPAASASAEPAASASAEPAASASAEPGASATPADSAAAPAGSAAPVASAAAPAGSAAPAASAAAPAGSAAAPAASVVSTTDRRDPSPVSAAPAPVTKPAPAVNAQKAPAAAAPAKAKAAPASKPAAKPAPQAKPAAKKKTKYVPDDI